ncbi:MAG: DUF1304 domain-containing protein [Gammaproteobacteria bacterium]
MTAITNILIGIVALLHLYFLVLEMFLWDKPTGLRTFGHDPDFARKSKALAMNQGLYNGFLALGLAWGLSLGAGGDAIKIFFLACVVAAGVFGGLSVHRKILLIQALPALVALLLLVLS